MTGMDAPAAPGTVPVRAGTAREVLLVFARLGLTSFGGPVAHLGYFHEAFVVRRRWLSEAQYADLVALCQFLPGPASSQVGMAIGLQRAGLRGLLAAWAAFTLPSAVLMVAVAAGVGALGVDAGAGWLLGLKAAAAAVVAHAVITMARSLAPDAPRASIAALAMILVLLIPGPFVQVAAIVVAGLVGVALLGRGDAEPGDATPEAAAGSSPAPQGSRRLALGALVAFAVLILGLPLLAAATGDPSLRLADVMYRAGALVFGGGHVVLPLLETGTVQTGMVDEQTFLAGYGAAQAVPGPLFTLSAFLGFSAGGGAGGPVGAAIALGAMFLPGALLVIGALPFWDRLRSAPRARHALLGTNAAVVGILAAALYDPVLAQGAASPATLGLAVAALVALMFWRVPAWAVVLAAGAVGAIVL